MKKLALEDLTVEGFEPSKEVAGLRGTVKAHISDSTCYEEDCWCSTRISCPDTCYGPMC
jgi:hypothetical protein